VLTARARCLLLCLQLLLRAGGWLGVARRAAAAAAATMCTARHAFFARARPTEVALLHGCMHGEEGNHDSNTAKTA
jgi:hypothetical protein